MRLYYPRSFSGLLFLGFALVALPLMVALINNAISIDRLVNRSQVAVYQAVQATQNSRRLVESLTALERIARQIVILGDRSMLDAYVLSRRQFLQATEFFTVPPFESSQMAALDKIVAGESGIFRTLVDETATSADLRQASQRFVQLGELGRTINMHSNEMIDREIQAMRTTAAQALRIIFWQMLALLPVAVFLAVGFAILIARPIREINTAIRKLGGGELDVPVSVSGPVDLQYLGERLEWMRRKLLEVEDQKNRFLRQVSHELKTPLTALREGAELLHEEAVGKLNTEQHEVAEILRHQSLKLQKLIEDLLSYSASHFQGEALDLAPVNMKRLIERVADDQRLALRSRNLKLDVDADEKIIVAGDFEKLRGMLDNLLSNAIKFSPDGGTISVRTRRDGAQVELQVSDDGPGIAPEDRVRIFEPFYQGAVSGNGLVKGTGVGLSIVRDYVQAHGGSVDIVDAGATGTQFRVRLPMLQPTAQPS